MASCGKCRSNMLTTEVTAEVIILACVMCGWRRIYVPVIQPIETIKAPPKEVKPIFVMLTCQNKRCKKKFKATKSPTPRKYCPACKAKIRKKQNRNSYMNYKKKHGI